MSNLCIGTNPKGLDHEPPHYLLFLIAFMEIELDFFFFFFFEAYKCVILDRAGTRTANAAALSHNGSID